VGELFLRRIARSTKVGLVQYARETIFILPALVQLIRFGKVEYLGGYLFLSGEQHTVATRTRRKKTTAAKFAELEPLISILRKLPGIAGVAITGSAAVFNADTNDDVDLLIITEDQRLWILRPLILFFAFLYGKRRTWHREEKNSWCFNLWLERSALAQPRPSHSLYVAYEVCQAKWVIDVGDCKQSFLRRNHWVRSYIPVYYSWCKDQSVVYTYGSQQNYLAYWPVLSECIGILNYCAYLLQRWYMSQHMTRERVTLQAAFFHPRDTGLIVAAKYHDIVRKL
jgi:predicted nucleotidyltransferase